MPKQTATEEREQLERDKRAEWEALNRRRRGRAEPLEEPENAAD